MEPATSWQMAVGSWQYKQSQGSQQSVSGSLSILCIFMKFKLPGSHFRLVFERFDLFRGREKIKVPIFTE